MLLYQVLTFCSIVYFGAWNVAEATKFRRHASSVASPRCRNPNGSLGTCVSLNECEPLKQLLLQLNDRSYRFVQASRCAGSGNRYVRQRAGSDSGMGKPPYVCCTNDTEITESSNGHGDSVIFPDDKRLKSTTTTTTTTSQKPTTTMAPEQKLTKLPQPPHCGSVALSTRIYGGGEAELNEFPWMVNLEYSQKNSDEMASVCAGSLINERYVLTAAHCVKGAIEEKIGQIVSVRLGEHNTARKVDCDAGGCNVPTQRVFLEDITVHKDYDTDRKLGIHQHHDIALLRLDRAVSFTHAIQPVCLPHAESEPQLTDGLKLTVAGWGHNGTVSRTDAKQKVRLPYVDLAQCRQIYRNKMYISDEQICAGGIYMQDSCSGDSGGPLMRLGSSAWMLEGIVSFGLRCGLEQPGIYTRVRRYVNWLEQHVKP